MAELSVKKQIGDKELIISTGKLAKQAGGSVVVKYGGNAVLVTACAADEAMEGQDFFPLTVNYFEKYYAAGKIPGGYIKREGKPSDDATLVARLIDRPIRPLFPKEFKNETQIVVTTLAADQVYPIDAVGIIGASAALSISDIPFTEPCGGLRIVYTKDGQYVPNPTLKQVDEALLDIVVAGTREGITMVEGGALEVGEDVLLKALEVAQEHINHEIDIIEELVGMVKPVKREVPSVESAFDEAIRNKLIEIARPLIEKANNNKEKHARSQAVKEAMAQVLEQMEIDKEHEGYKEAKEILEEVEVETVRNQIVNEDVRADGRKMDEIRDITVEIDLFDSLHGSALFTRGQTQSLGVVTLGSSSDVKYIDNLESNESQTKSFLLHYNFPPYSVGEVKRMSFVSRREIGHGHLAERAITGVLPNIDDFPYVIRMVSEVLESNGSSSMATVCSASLSLMAAGVPTSKQVAGIAMGLVWDKEKGVHKVLSDIQGLEDHHGDMDFKVAGTRDGITAFQMDVKTVGITREIMSEALQQAKDGRMFILGKMDAVIDKPREEVADSAPKVELLKVDTDSIGMVIGSGGKTIKRIMAETGADLNIEDDGTVTIYCPKKEGVEKAKKMVEMIVRGLNRGDVLDGTVGRIEKYGVFLDFGPGLPSVLLHQSQFKEKGYAEERFKLGDVIKVEVEGFDNMRRAKIKEL